MRITVIDRVLIASTGVYAQNYPARTVRIVVPYAPGGNTDFTARVIATKLTEVFGQQVVVENRAGGATNIGTDLVAKAVARWLHDIDGRRVQRDQHEPVSEAALRHAARFRADQPVRARARTCSPCIRRCR